jgi:hypothetical protein
MVGMVALIFQVLPDGFGTFPALRGLPRDHRAVPSLALDEYEFVSSIVSQSVGGVNPYFRFRTIHNG